MDPSFLARNVNEGFSGGEKKRNEILQLAVMESEMSILDEIDSGGRRASRRRRRGERFKGWGQGPAAHHPLPDDAIHPDFVHVMQKGKDRPDGRRVHRAEAGGGRLRGAAA